MITVGNTDILLSHMRMQDILTVMVDRAKKLNYVTVITQTGTSNIITGYPGSGPKYQEAYALIGD